MSFFDGFDLVDFEIPIGWGYDTLASNFPLVVVRRWDRVDEWIGVRASPSAVPPRATNEEWLAAVGVRSPWFTAARLLRGLPGHTIAGYWEPGSDPPNRAAIVRGPRFDVVLGHVCGPPSSEVLTEPLARIVSTLKVPANAHLPESTSEAAIEVLMNSLSSGDIEAFRGQLEQLLTLGQAAIVHGLLENDVSLVDAGLGARISGLFGTARLYGDLRSLYLAQQCVSRLARQDGPRRDDVAPEDADTDSQLTQLHQVLVDLPEVSPLWESQREMLRGTHESCVTADGLLTAPLPDVIAVGLFANGFLQVGRREAEKANRFVAPSNLWFGVDVAASLLVASRAQSLSPQASALYEQTGIAALHEASMLLQRAERKAYGTPTRVDQCELRVALMRRRIKLAPDEPDVRAQLAHDLAQLVLARGRLTGPEVVALNRRLVNEARSLIEPDTPSNTRALVELAEVTVLIAEHAPTEAMLGAFARARERADPSMSGVAEEALGQFAAALCDDGRVAEAAGLLESWTSADRVVPPASVTIAKAYVAARQGDLAQARNLVADGLLWAMNDGSLHTGVRGLLKSASRMFRALDPDLAVYMDRTLLVVDRLYIGESIADDESRIRFGEEGDQRTLAEQVVERLIGRNRLGEALEVADDARAVVLRAELGARGLDAPVTKVQLPDQQHIDGVGSVLLPRMTQAVREIAEPRLRELGRPIGLPWADLVSTGVEGGRQALLVQPVGDRVYLLHVDTRGEIHGAMSQASRADLVRHVGRLRSEFGIEGAPSTRGENPFLPALRRSRTSWEESLVALHAALIDPIEAALEEAPLVVVPYGDLALLPWNALGASGTPLIDSVAVSIVPSLATLNALRNTRTARGRPEHVVVVADPTLDARHGLAPLPGARREAHAVIDMLRAAGVEPATIQSLIGHDATESAVREAAAGADLIHFACHASLRDPVAMSALFLAAGRGDGLLMATEVGEVPLRDALVFLSACETGAGTPTVDGVLGLSRACLKAGARAVIMSLWAVDDVATCRLVAYFYADLLGVDGDALPADQSLARAIRHLRSDLGAGRLAADNGATLPDHPSIWAPFLVLGDGGFGYEQSR